VKPLINTFPPKQKIFVFSLNPAPNACTFQLIQVRVGRSTLYKLEVKEVFKALILLSVLVLMGLIFGWQTLIFGFAIGIIILIWWIVKGNRSPAGLAQDSAQNQASDIDEDSWFIERDARGNRFMIGDPLDTSMQSSDEERAVLVQEMTGNGKIQLPSSTLAMRSRVLNDPDFLTTSEGIEMMNALGGGAYDSVNDRVSNWQTNDFRRLGIEFLTFELT